MFPESFTFSIADWVNGWVDSLVTNYGDVFRQISDTLLWAIVNLEGLLRMAPWWLMLAIVGFGVFNTVTALSEQYTLTLVARFMCGVAAGLAWGVIAGYARRMVSVSQQGRAMAVAMIGAPLALSYAQQRQWVLWQLEPLKMDFAPSLNS